MVMVWDSITSQSAARALSIHSALRPLGVDIGAGSGLIHTCLSAAAATARQCSSPWRGEDRLWTGGMAVFARMGTLDVWSARQYEQDMMAARVHILGRAGYIDGNRRMQ
jgi:hypothetical protein